jgi:hypothetical protein
MKQSNFLKALLKSKKRKTLYTTNVTEQPKVNTLNSTIAKYIDAKKAEWTAKSKMEFSGIFKLLVNVLGDLEVSAITRSTVLELRSTLQNLPPNVYKKGSSAESVDDIRFW